ncbi:maleylpyruvate isomerase family mycothiol-dependent enzyme [Actinosynnema sp. NPDC020468]|uniref:maleylpyruvate isomerase family mycothiol-dependent enzyme n=1 Tax=Actinosynnema sp. NPDC020468 TaxID=3154488 RepID=UPI0033D82855
MHNTLGFPDLLRLIDERATAFGAEILAAPDLDARVPSCPAWTLLDLVRHLGDGRRRWATIVAAGPEVAPPAKVEPKDAPALPRDRAELVAWWTESARRLLDALREVGPDHVCWVGWGDSQSPPTAGAVARHQVQEIAVHTYDAQLAQGAPRPLPVEVALDGVEEFLVTCVATTSPWPHKPAIIHYAATEGRSWRVALSADGARITRVEESDEVESDASLRGTASQLVQAFYSRVPVDELELGGDPVVFEQLIAWDPGA